MGFGGAVGQRVWGRGLGERAPGEGRFTVPVVPGRWPGLGSCCGGHVVGLACRAGVIAGPAAVTGQDGQS